MSREALEGALSCVTARVRVLMEPGSARGAQPKGEWCRALPICRLARSGFAFLPRLHVGYRRPRSGMAAGWALPAPDLMTTYEVVSDRQRLRQGASYGVAFNTCSNCVASRRNPRGPGNGIWCGSAPLRVAVVPEDVLADYLRDRLAATSVGPRQSRLATWSASAVRAARRSRAAHPCGAGGHHVRRVDPECFRSCSNYSSDVKDEHIRAGHLWTKRLAQEARLSIRSVTRGMGPPRQAQPMPFLELCALELGALPVSRDVPWNPKAVAVISSGFLLREIKAAYAQTNHLTIDEGSKPATLLVPVSKTDRTAVGCRRAWRCTCVGREIEADCVHHECADHARLLRAHLGHSVGNPPLSALPRWACQQSAGRARGSLAAAVFALRARSGLGLWGSAWTAIRRSGVG